MLSNTKCLIEPKVRVRRSLWFRHFQGYVWIIVNILISAPFEEETQLEIMYMSDEHNPDLNSICLMKLQTIKPLVSRFALFFPFQPLLYFCEQRNVQVPALLQIPPPVNSQLTVRSARHGSVRTRAVLFRVQISCLLALHVVSISACLGKVWNLPYCLVNVLKHISDMWEKQLKHR